MSPLTTNRFRALRMLQSWRLNCLLICRTHQGRRRLRSRRINSCYEHVRISSTVSPQLLSATEGVCRYRPFGLASWRPLRALGSHRPDSLPGCQVALVIANDDARWLWLDRLPNVDLVAEPRIHVR